ncbi:hypothetical protein SEA_PEPE25_98 [Microbacterium phage Pepe25]|nr:hypothetical protein SEA_PEPE25_98 [Microbacterium phage Pepe25]
MIAQRTENTMSNTNAADWQDDLETYHDAYANVIIYDADQTTHLTDFSLQPAELRVVFAALRDAALPPKITPELLELSKQVLNDHGIRDAMPDDPGSIAQLTVALRSLIKAVES